MAKDALEDAVSASATAATLVFAGWLSVGIQPIVPMIQYLWLLAQGVQTAPVPTESILEFAMRQGGAFAILLIVLWFYRRDYRDLVAFRTERDKLLVELVENSTKSNAEMAAALRENNIVVHRAKNVMQEYLPLRRDDDRP